MQTEAVPRARLLSIDALRGLAALAVLCSHLPYSATLSPRDLSSGVVFSAAVTRTLGFGRVGVHLFLVLSGFCIHMQWARARESSSSFADFWRRRLGRLYPPYFAALLLTVAGLFFIFHGHRESFAARFGYASGAQLGVDLVLLLLLLQNFNGSSARVGNNPFWTLALEEQLYVLYFPLRFLRRRWGWSTALFVVAMVTFSWRALRPAGGFALSPVWLTLGPARWIEWTLGALAVESYLGRVTLPPITRSPIMFVLLLSTGVSVDLAQDASPVMFAIFGDVLYGLAFFTLVNWCCQPGRLSRAHGPAWRMLSRVGIWSYSLYLIHAPVLVLAKRIAFGLGLSIAGTTTLRIAIPLAAGYAFHVVVERRFMGGARSVNALQVAAA